MNRLLILLPLLLPGPLATFTRASGLRVTAKSTCLSSSSLKRNMSQCG